MMAVIEPQMAAASAESYGMPLRISTVPMLA